MHAVEQLTLDLAGQNLETQLNAQWAATRARDAHNWTPESMARTWSGFPDWDSWNAMPNYFRSMVQALYDTEQADLAWCQSVEFPLCEIFNPDGTVETRNYRPFWRPQIRRFHEVYHEPDRASLDAHWAIASAMAAQLSADWSADRRPSIFTYDRAIAATVSMLLGRHIEAITPAAGDELQARFKTPFKGPKTSLKPIQTAGSGPDPV